MPWKTNAQTHYLTPHLMKSKIKDIINSSKFKTIGFSVTAAFLFYALLGFLILPTVISSQAAKIVSEKLNRELIVSNIQFNPFSLEFAIDGFEIKNLNGSSFVNFERLYINVAVLQSIADLTVTIDQVLLKKPYVLVKRGKQGDFNFSDLLSDKPAEAKTEPKDSSVFPLNITQIAITEGKLRWEDDFYSRSQYEDITPLNLTINNFTTIINEQSQLGFSLKLASGGNLDWQGQIKLNPFQSTGHIKLEKVNFHKVWQLFLQDSVNFKVLSGSELIEADYSLSDATKGMQLLLSKAQINLFDLKISEKKQTEALINVPGFKLSGISVNLLKKTVKITKVSANDARFKAWLNTDGSINYQSLFALSNKEQSPQSPSKSDSEPSSPWKVSVKQLALNNWSFDFTDKSLATPAHINISALALNSTELTNKPGATLPFDLGLIFNQQGKLAINGQAILAPFSSDLKINLDNIAIADFQPYISQFARLDIISGLFNLSANVSLQQKDDEAMAINFTGDSYISNFVSRDQISNKDFLNWKQLSLNTIDLDIAANRYTIDTVKIDQLYSKVLIRKDKSMNISDISIPSKEKPVDHSGNEEGLKQQSVYTETPKPFFKIAHFKIINGSTDFSDKSLILPFSAHIDHLKGEVKGISSEPNAVINTKLNGRIDNLAPVIIKGKITPSNGNSDFSLNFKSMPLPLMTPYMAEFAGRKIEKGNMSLSLKYKIKNKQLSASNNLLIDQLVLGEEVENPDAVSLPLDLAIALLQDTDGKITLDVPITGDLDNPEFSITSIVVDALVNVITKIITSPFSAIASLIGSDEDISKITFLAGDSDLNIKQQEKLDALVIALSERPALKLEIKGAAYSNDDWPQLQAEALNNQLLNIWADELNKDNDKKNTSEHLTLTEKMYQQLLADQFIQKFPELGERSLFGTPRLINNESADFYRIAQIKLSVIIPSDSHRLHKLAVSRAQAIAEYLVAKGIKIERMFLLDVAIDPEDPEGVIASTLSLTVN